MNFKTLVVVHAEQDAALGERLRGELTAKGYTLVAELKPGAENLLISVISPGADSPVQANTLQALDAGQTIIPILVGGAALPKLLNHLPAVDFNGGYSLQALTQRIDALSSAETRLPLKVLTPKARQANRGTAIWLAIIVMISFIFGVILVGFFGAQAPRETYNNIATIDFATIGAMLDQSRPRSTEDAINFPATIQAIPSPQRPFVIATATAQAAPK